MTDLERIRAKFAAEYGLSEDMLRNAERWTETTGDLEGVPENLLPGILGMRFGAIAIDTPRSERWSTPEDIDVIADLAYLPDGGYDTAAGACRGHLLDLYLPHDAVLRGGHTLPVYIDIHGGGFTYGYKELNRNFNVHLAEQGFAVFSLNYRPAPQTDLRGQLARVGEQLVPFRAEKVLRHGNLLVGIVGKDIVTVESLIRQIAKPAIEVADAASLPFLCVAAAKGVVQKPRRDEFPLGCLCRSQLYRCLGQCLSPLILRHARATEALKLHLKRREGVDFLGDRKSTRLNSSHPK